MSYSIDELIGLEDTVVKYINENATEIITRLSRFGELDGFLDMIGLKSLQTDNQYETFKDGKILVIGDSAVKTNELTAIIKDLGIDKSRLELDLGYDRAKTYPYTKLQYASQYRVVIIGPVPHSGKGKSVYSSILQRMRSESGFPRIEVLESNKALKITKTNFKIKLKELLDEDYI